MINSTSVSCVCVCEMHTRCKGSVVVCERLHSHIVLGCCDTALGPGEVVVILVPVDTFVCVCVFC